MNEDGDHQVVFIQRIVTNNQEPSSFKTSPSVQIFIWKWDSLAGREINMQEKHEDCFSPGWNQIFRKDIIKKSYLYLKIGAVE